MIFEFRERKSNLEIVEMANEVERLNELYAY